MMRFEIVGQKIKPYVRMTQRGKFVRVRNGKLTQAAEYLDSKAALQWQFRAQMMGHEPFGREPLCVSITVFYRGGYHNHDLDNVIKALLDAMNGIVYADDRWIDAICAVRGSADDEELSAVVRVGTLDELRFITVF
jgi:Holliday junction resolvase RusA-like endonuclease